MSGRASVSWYQQHAADLSARYEAVDPNDLYAWTVDLLPKAGALALDVGAGTGRDAAWLVARGFEVVALEPSAAMRATAEQLHGELGIRWIDDALPSLDVATKSGLSFDLILLSGVWQHVSPADRVRAFRKVTALLKPSGLIMISLRLGPADLDRSMHEVSLGEVETLARDHGLIVQKVDESADRLGRADLRWISVALRLPDDGTGALPLLRHVILNDAKSSTYKLALLRALCRIADGWAGLADEEPSGEGVRVPLGLVALTWIRLFLPLLRRDLPQSPSNARAGERLGFADEAFRRLMAADNRPCDLHPGAVLQQDVATAVAAALTSSARLIAEMPVRYMAYPSGGQILQVERSARRSKATGGHLDRDFLRSFGEMRIPAHLWRALQRFSCWIEPALVSEWGRLMKGYAASQDRALDDHAIAAAMVWVDPERNIGVPRRLALDIMAAGGRLHCAWSGKLLEAGTLDIDHCFPWTLWPSSDLWNLLPTDRRVNQRDKRDRVPGERRLREAEKQIVEWWSRSYLAAPLLATRFWDEAAASLPLTASMGKLSSGDIVASMHLQRIRLRHDQQAPEWQ